MNKITSEQLVVGFIAYMDHEVLPNIDDTFTKLAVRMFTIAANTNAAAYEHLIDGMIKSPFAAEFLQVDDDKHFDIEVLIDALRQAINECGELVVKIPPVKFVSPEEKVLCFKASDVSTLKQYITAAANGKLERSE